MSQARQTLHDGYRSLALLLQVNGDRLLFPVAIALALSMAGYIAGF